MPRRSSVRCPAARPLAACAAMTLCFAGAPASAPEAAPCTPTAALVCVKAGLRELEHDARLTSPTWRLECRSAHVDCSSCEPDRREAVNTWRLPDGWTASPDDAQLQTITDRPAEASAAFVARSVSEMSVRSQCRGPDSEDSAPTVIEAHVTVPARHRPNSAEVARVLAACGVK